MPRGNQLKSRRYWIELSLIATVSHNDCAFRRRAHHRRAIGPATSHGIRLSNWMIAAITAPGCTLTAEPVATHTPYGGNEHLPNLVILRRVVSHRSYNRARSCVVAQGHQRMLAAGLLP